MPDRFLGKREPVDRPTLHAAQFLKVQVEEIPVHPPVSPPPVTTWPMDRNDQAGVCVVAGMDHTLQTIAFNLGLPRTNWSDAEILELYRTQNPDFQSWADGGGDADGGMVIQTFLEECVRRGIIVAFAKIDHKNAELMRAASYVGQSIMTGELLRIAHQTQAVWDAAGGGSWGGHCLAPETRVLTADLRWIPVGHLARGDALIGFDEWAGGGKQRQYRTSIVEEMKTIDLACYELEFDDGTTVTASRDHMWLVRDNRWTQTQNMKVGISSVRKPLEVWQIDDSRDAGYLAAAFDGEGWIDGEQSRAIHRIGFAQRENAMWDYVTKALAERGFIYAERESRISGFGKNMINQLNIGHRDQLYRFLGSIRPHRLLEKFDVNRMGAMHCRDVRLIRKTYVGHRPVVAMRTSSRTFVAEGLASHNCTNTVGYDSPRSRQTCVTWGELQPYTDAFAQRNMDEAWLILTADMIKAPGFRNNFDLAGFADAISDLTDGKVVVPVDPPSTDPMRDFPFRELNDWAYRHPKSEAGYNRTARAAYQAWKTAHGL